MALIYIFSATSNGPTDKNTVRQNRPVPSHSSECPASSLECEGTLHRHVEIVEILPGLHKRVPGCSTLYRCSAYPTPGNQAGPGAQRLLVPACLLFPAQMPG